MRLDGLLVINLYLFIYVNTPKNKKNRGKESPRASTPLTGDNSSKHKYTAMVPRINLTHCLKHNYDERHKLMNL